MTITQMEQNIKQIEKILQGRFAAEEDRQYWERRLAEEQQKI